MTFFHSFDSPIGTILIATDGAHITQAHIEGDHYFTSIPLDWHQAPDHPLLNMAGNQLAAYFSKKNKEFTLPLLPEGSVFQQTVWKALQEIPYGTTVNYNQIAKMIDHPKAARAVGSAIGRNPICIFIPCHRVLTSSGKLGGFVAGEERKKQLLQMEAL